VRELNASIYPIASTASVAPVDPTRRIDAIDVLRGIALFGVLMVNLVTEFRVSIFEQFLPPGGSTQAIDSFVQWFVSVFLESKAFALFSLLFGVGLAIQFEHLAVSGSRARLLVRRLVVLLAFGLVHFVFIWNGDILTEYALVGLVALPFLYSPSAVLAVASLSLLAFFLSLPLLLPPSFWPTQAWIQQHIAEANHVYSAGSYTDILSLSAREIPYIVPLHMDVAARTLALFLMGILAWRVGLLSKPTQNKRLLVGIATIALPLGTALSLLDTVGPHSTWAPLARSIWWLIPLGPVVLALGYAGAVISLVSFAKVGLVLRLFGPLGRMAFTNYLLQSLVFCWIFFGYGLGYFGHLGAAQTLALGLIVYAIQIAGSTWWLRRFRFGPVEWLWRTLMYGARQPMNR
jgi:uncharacterized protein